MKRQRKNIMLREDLHVRLLHLKADTGITIYEHIDRAVESYLNSHPRRARTRKDDRDTNGSYDRSDVETEETY